MISKKNAELLASFEKDLYSKEYSKGYIHRVVGSVKRLAKENGKISKKGASTFCKYMEENGVSERVITNFKQSIDVFIKWKNGSLKQNRSMKFKGCDEDCFHCRYPDCYLPDKLCTIEWDSNE